MPKSEGGGPKITVIIPVYNEVARIPRNIANIFSYLEKFPYSSEVLFVNDGSTDGTQKLLEELQNKYSFRVIQYPHNRGKGCAVRQGVAKARGEYIVFFDIDLATPLETMEKLVPLMYEKRPIIIGNRRLSQSSIHISESPLRTFLGQGFTLISRAFVPEVTDFTCGFKCFHADAARYLFSRAQIDRWAFDTEILYLARRYDYPIHQIPVHWVHDTDSRVRMLRDVWRSLQDIGKIILNIGTGRYRI